MVIGTLQNDYKDDKLTKKYRFRIVLNDIKDENSATTRTSKGIYTFSKWQLTMRKLGFNYFKNEYSDKEFFKIIQAFKSDIRIKNLLNKYPIKNNNFEYNFPLKLLSYTIVFSLLFSTILILLFSTVSFLNKKWTLIRTMEKTSIVFIVFLGFGIIRNFF